LVPKIGDYRFGELCNVLLREELRELRVVDSKLVNALVREYPVLRGTVRGLGHQDLHDLAQKEVEVAVLEATGVEYP